MNNPNSMTVTLSADLREMSRNERIKVESRGLFLVSPDGTTFQQEIRDLSSDTSSTLSGTGKELSKFFGIYRQQARGERGKKLKEYFFMVRIKNPGGGLLSPNQWKALDDAASEFADGTLRITSRQAIQYHHVNGPALAPLIRFLSRHYRPDATLAACGDVNRNVMAPAAPYEKGSYPAARKLANDIADVLSPQKDGVEFTLLSPSREEPNVRTNGYTIDLVNGDIVGYFDWNDNEGLGLNLWYLEENRKRRFPTMRIFKSYVGTFISRYYEQEIIIAHQGDLENILNGKPMQFNVS